MNEIVGIAPGKVILLGEHAVVYGYPAIAIPIELYSNVIITDNDNEKISIDVPNFNISLFGGNIAEAFSNSSQILDPIKYGLQFWERQNHSISGIRIKIRSDIWPGSGLGSSASIAIALYSALQKKYHLPFNQADAIEFGFQMDKIAHGRPSGIDNTVCAVNEPIYFKQQSFHPLKINFPASLLIIDSGQPHNTQIAVNQIAHIKEKDPNRMNDIFYNIGALVDKGTHEFERGNLEHFQSLMEENQHFLEHLGLMTEPMRKIYDFGIQMDIRGLKLTGAGQGGCLIAFDNHLKLQKFQKELNIKGIRNYLFQIPSVNEESHDSNKKEGNI